MEKTIHCYVSGRVQGVCFRLSTQEKAKVLGVNGWVGNLNDGRVELMASGEEAIINELREWLNHGPKMAKVLSVECHNIDYQAFPDFSIR